MERGALVSWALGVLAVLAAAAVAAWLVLGAMRRTARRQQAGLPPLPACPPAGVPVLRAEGARYLGTTYAPSPVRRFSGYGLLGRAVVELTAAAGGLRIGSGPAGPWCVPTAALRSAEVGTGHAGKMVYAERVLLVDWQLGETVLRSGFVLADEAVARRWADWLAAAAGPGDGHSDDQEEARR